MAQDLGDRPARRCPAGMAIGRRNDYLRVVAWTICSPTAPGI